ncbi:hypothetical protein Tco_1560064, partial [Tanacetum coccineum]
GDGEDKVSLELTEEIIQSMEVGVAFRDYGKFVPTRGWKPYRSLETCLIEIEGMEESVKELRLKDRVTGA